MMEERTLYFTADEFLICCAAVKMERFYGFPLPDGSLTRQSAAQGLFSLVHRGLLRCEKDEFVLCPELSSCFGLLRESGTVVFAYQRQDSMRQPCCLLYGGGEQFAALTPGCRRADYVGVKQYRDEAEWLQDTGLAPEENLPQDLAELTVQEWDTVCERLVRFAAGGPAPDPLPEEVFGYLEGRRLTDWQLTARTLLVRQPLFDCIVTGTGDRAATENYRLNRLAALVRDMRIGRMMLA